MICLPINYYLFGKDKFISYFGYDFKIYLLYLYIELFFVRRFIKSEKQPQPSSPLNIVSLTDIRCCHSINVQERAAHAFQENWPKNLNFVACPCRHFVATDLSGIQVFLIFDIYCCKKFDVIFCRQGFRETVDLFFCLFKAVKC